MDGAENIPANGPCLIVGLHSSHNTDIPIRSPVCFCKRCAMFCTDVLSLGAALSACACTVGCIMLTRHDHPGSAFYQQIVTGRVARCLLHHTADLLRPWLAPGCYARCAVLN
eukprot:1827273-Rhodomonas_salina.1